MALEHGWIWCRSAEMTTYVQQPWKQCRPSAAPRPQELPLKGEGSDSVIYGDPSRESGRAQVALFKASSVRRLRCPLGLKEIIVRVLHRREMCNRAHRGSEEY